jgi:uncharacterized membrane protein YeaQ/YmgE (transglycosylase-associated protein family)
MAIVAWILLGLAVGAVVHALGRDAREPAGTNGTLGLTAIGAVFGGLIALSFDVGSIGEFFDIGAWLFAIAGALLALVAFNAWIGSREESRGASFDA